jgi:hypothetical protein
MGKAGAEMIPKQTLVVESGVKERRRVCDLSDLILETMIMLTRDRALNLTMFEAASLPLWDERRPVADTDVADYLHRHWRDNLPPAYYCLRLEADRRGMIVSRYDVASRINHVARTICGL